MQKRPLKINMKPTTLAPGFLVNLSEAQIPIIYKTKTSKIGKAMGKNQLNPLIDRSIAARKMAIIPTKEQANMRGCLIKARKSETKPQIRVIEING